MKIIPCQYLGEEVELSPERLQHIQERHPGTLPEYEQQLEETITNPDLIRRSEKDPSALIFSKWFTSIRTGRFLIAIVVAESDSTRFWIVTAYTARKITGGITVWTKT
ncbi:MAG: PBECR2 nuclease fold domain-containing protein [Synechocystis sp.]|nr:PBECR2 nuclease fold domain-containing protein [Synechocystis sp.]